MWWACLIDVGSSALVRTLDQDLSAAGDTVRGGACFRLCIPVRGKARASSFLTAALVISLGSVSKSGLASCDIHELSDALTYAWACLHTLVCVCIDMRA